MSFKSGVKGRGSDRWWKQRWWTQSQCSKALLSKPTHFAVADFDLLTCRQF